MVGDFQKRTVWLACLMLVLSTTFALGQGIVAGSIAGTVVDPQKAVVVGAKVVVLNVGTNVEFKATTNEQGYFSIRSIPPGAYRLTVEAPNFKKLEAGGVVVNTGQTSDVGALTLALGATAETVTVEGAAPLIETQTSQGGSTFTASTSQQQPLLGGFDQLVLFTPGVVNAGNLGMFANTNGASFGINGQRDRSNNFEIDGQFNNSTGVTGPAIFYTNQDGLQEVQVVTNNFGVEYGRNSGGTINYVTKSGTNNFHGSAFEYFQGDWADSLTHLEQPAMDGSGVVPRFVDNRWGGTLGGPILENKIFFFTSYLQETSKGSSSPSVSDLLTPTPAGLATLTTCFPGNAALAVLKKVGPYSIAQGSPAPSGTPVSVDLTGCPGVAMDGVTRSLPAIFNDYEAVGRVDMVLSPKDNLFVRYLFTQNVFAGSNGGAGQYGTPAEEGTQDDLARSQQAAVDWTRNWTSHLVNQVRVSYTRSFSGYQNGDYLGCTTAAIGSCPPWFEMGDGAMPFGLGVNLPQSGLTNNTQFQNNASWQHGRHTVKFGGEYVRQRSPNVFLPTTNGEYFFEGSGAGDFAGAWNNFFAQSPSQVSLVNGPTIKPFKEQDSALYVGDDWRIRDNLTLNLGVRWEFQQQAINLLAQNTVAQQTGPNPFWNTSLPLSQTTLPILPNHWDHFAPNVGFAWTPHIFENILGHDKTVVRGGFRLAYDPSFYNIFLNVASAAPAVIAGAISPAVCGIPCPVASTGSEVKTLLGGFLPTGGNPGNAVQTHVTGNFTNPYAEEWSLGVQREVNSHLAAEVRYLGTHTVHEFQTVNGNPQLLCGGGGVQGGTGANACIGGLYADFPAVVPTGITPCSNPAAPGYALGFVNCNNTLYRLRDNGSTGSYNSMQSQLKFQNFHGFTAVAAYTWSKNIDNASEIFSTYGPSPVAGPQDPFCPKACEVGLSALDYPNNFTLYWQYELPFGKGQQGLVGKLTGGWALAGNYRYTSGQVWSPFEDPNTDIDCNDTFNGHFFGVSSCRPFAGNYAAPVTMIGIICDGSTTSGECPNGTGGALPFGTLVNFYDPCLNTGGTAAACGVTAINKSAVHWIINDINAAKFFGTPFGNVGRNPGVRGQTVNTVNLNVIKNNRVSEKVNVRLEMNVYNVMNHLFLGVPAADITSDGPYCFGTVNCNDSGGLDYDSGAAFAGGLANGLAQRRVVLGAHIIF